MVSKGMGLQSPERLQLIDPAGSIFCTANLGCDFVAMKRFRVDLGDEGVPSTLLREVSLLQNLRHEHVVSLLDIFVGRSGAWLAFELMDCDLKQYMKARNLVLSPEVVKSFMKHLTMGMEYVHASGILHRDIKPQNILVRNEKLKICDFGMARQ